MKIYIKYIMVAASILPVAIHKGKLYFLFGKENQMEDSARGFSDFGGGLEDDETIMETALREGSEELSGFLGDSKAIKALMQGGVYKISHGDYHIHIFLMKYDENLPCYFTNHHRFVWDRMDKNVLNDSKYFEKQEIRWFSIEDMKKGRKMFRGFYREIVDHILSDMSNIKSFVKKVSSVYKGAVCSRSTRKNNKGENKIAGG
jgi:8-oxo-dGTP pyrophosphatase MutT (NUDIX family)